MRLVLKEPIAEYAPAPARAREGVVSSTLPNIIATIYRADTAAARARLHALKARENRVRMLAREACPYCPFIRGPLECPLFWSCALERLERSRPR